MRIWNLSNLSTLEIGRIEVGRFDMFWWFLIALGRAAAAAVSNGEADLFCDRRGYIRRAQMAEPKEIDQWKLTLQAGISSVNCCDWTVIQPLPCRSQKTGVFPLGVSRGLGRMTTPQVKGNSLLPPALSHPQITAVGYFTNYFSVGLDAQTATWWLEGWKLLFPFA
jgi:hypothetical protein